MSARPSSPAMGGSVVVNVNGPVGTLTLNRPQALNAFDRILMEDIIAAARWFDTQEEVKVVIVQGEGRAFCAGFDLQHFSSLASPNAVREVVALGRPLADAVARMRATTIAAVHGHCVGGGVVLATACDFRYASVDARFHLPETALGIPLAWGGVPWLVREIGPMRAMEFVLLCERIDAATAADMGLLNAVLPSREALLQQVRNTADTLARRSRLVLEATKQQVSAARDELAANHYSFCDAYLLHSAFTDEESRQSRLDYLDGLTKR